MDMRSEESDHRRKSSQVKLKIKRAINIDYLIIRLCFILFMDLAVGIVIDGLRVYNITYLFEKFLSQSGINVQFGSL